MRKIKFPSLELDDIIAGFDSIIVPKLTEKYEPFYDFNFFEDEFCRKTNYFVDWSNFDDAGYLVMSLQSYAGCNTDSKYIQKTYLEIYNKYIKRNIL